MHHYRQALLRMRQDDSDRDIAAARLMGRPKAAQWRRIATASGWLDPAQPLPEYEAIAAALGSPRKASTTISTLEAHRAQLGAWVEHGVSRTAIRAPSNPARESLQHRPRRKPIGTPVYPPVAGSITPNIGGSITAVG